MSGMQDKPDEYWREKLTDEQYNVLREGGTDTPFTGEYVHLKEDGMYHCAACGAPLFSSETKFDSKSGWPSFTQPAVADAVELRDDDSHGPPSPDGFGRVNMHRTEVVCRNCGGHLGHVFDDGPEEEGGKRYCINTTSLDFKQE